MNVVKGFMRHSYYGLAANTYSHIPEIAQRDLAARIDAAMRRRFLASACASAS